MHKRIVIIGAGPIGCFTGQLLKVNGYMPLLIEEHAEVGRPLHCTGLVGNKVFSEKHPFKIPTSSILNEINGAVIHFEGQSFMLERKKVAFVIDRERFDKDLSRGLDIAYDNRFVGFERNKNGYIVETDKNEIPADVIIAADGANSAMRRLLGQDSSISYYKGLQLRLKSRPRFKDFVEVYLTKSSFFWIVPEREDIVRVGTLSERPHSDLSHFIKSAKLKGELLEKFGGIVSVGICNNTVRDKVVLVGGAACQVKPLSYGGVYFGLKAANILVSCIKNNRLSDYDSLWKKELASDIKIGIKMNQIYRRLDKEEIRKLFKLLKSQKELIEKIGDFENHGRLILELLKKPNLYPRLGDLFRILFKAVFN